MASGTTMPPADPWAVMKKHPYLLLSLFLAFALITQAQDIHQQHHP
jgi:hypothetical protein